MPFKSLAVAGATIALALGATACGGSSTVAAKPAPAPTERIAMLAGQDTAIVLNPDFVTSLATFGLKTAALGGATLADGTAKFPITSGDVALYRSGADGASVEGQIHHTGSGLSLTKGSTVVSLTNFDLEPGSSRVLGTVTINGKVVSLSTPLFTLDGTKLHPLRFDPAAKTATFPAAQLRMAPSAAALLNHTFANAGFYGGWLVGVTTITLNT